MDHVGFWAPSPETSRMKPTKSRPWRLATKLAQKKSGKRNNQQKHLKFHCFMCFYSVFEEHFLNKNLGKKHLKGEGDDVNEQL